MGPRRGMSQYASYEILLQMYYLVGNMDNIMISHITLVAKL